MNIRKATLLDLEYLNQLTRRSVMHWNYDPAFLEWEPEAITLTAAMIENEPVWVLDETGKPIGYYHLSGVPPSMVLDKMFLEPDHIGTGKGRMLWNHMITTAGELGNTELRWYADPNANGFYTAMGGEWLGEEETSWPGWKLQKFHISLT